MNVNFILFIENMLRMDFFLKLFGVLGLNMLNKILFFGDVLRDFVKNCLGLLIYVVWSIIFGILKLFFL